MHKLFIFFILLLPLSVVAQITISGRVLNKADDKPVANASVFLSNATIGTKTALDGSYSLYNVTPGKYDLVVSIVGFNAHEESIIAGKNNVALPDIRIMQKTIALQEVIVKPDLNRPRNYEWFKEQFLGSSDLARDCRILNPEILDLDYNEAAQTLTASSTDFLEIENPRLGYRIKYLLTNFLLDKSDKNNSKVFYKGSVLFAQMKGTVEKRRQWKNRRAEVYENSEMHFLRSLITGRTEDEGFSIQQLAIFANPQRPADSIIQSRIKYYNQLKATVNSNPDSLSYWLKKSKLPKSFEKLIHLPLGSGDFVKQTNQPGMFALGCDYDGLYITYSKTQGFSAAGQLAYVNTPRNTENTLISFNSPYAFFYSNGVLSNPYDVTFYGVWGMQRAAELLPVDYTPYDEEIIQAPVDSTIAKRIFAKTKTYSAGHISEKAYLHFDKPYYAAGDTIYFKAYLTEGDSNKVSRRSCVLNVDLINSNNKIDQSLKLQVTDGVAWGDFALPDSLPQNSYRVRAYTKWMTINGGEYFDKPLPIGSVSGNKVSESILPSIKLKADVQFFPEGGRLVTGLTSKIAFKAIGGNGLGINIKGEIIDNESKRVETFSSAHLGMGYFYINPAAGKTYKAKITYPDSSHDIIELPRPENNGVILSINNYLKSRATVSIAATNDFYLENKNKDFTLITYSAGVASSIIFKLDSSMITVDVLKMRLHTGIASVTLFSPGGQPLSERLLFVQNDDQLSTKVNSNKAVYTKREKVSLQFSVKNSTEQPSLGHFSVAVINENVVPFDENAENTILTSLLLTADLKGFVEQPNYYFTNASDKTSADLDLVMLTHGYRRFEWKKLLNDEYRNITLSPEKGLEISGVIKARNGTPLASGTVSLLSMNGGPAYSQPIANGSFSFSNLAFNDSSRFFVKAVSPALKNRTNIIYNSEPASTVTPTESPLLRQEDLQKLLAVYSENKKAQLDETKKYGSANSIMLKEVKVEHHIKDGDYPSSSLVGAGSADQVIHRKDFSGAGCFSDQFVGRLIGIIFIGDPCAKVAYLSAPISLSGNPPMLLVVDGVMIEGSTMSVDEINVNDIETIEVLKNASASIYGAMGGGGVLVITTRRGGDDSPGKGLAPGILAISPKGFYKAREFYAPKYDHQENNFKRKDLRSTIYWNPDLNPDKDGNASVGYYNADGTGTYRVIIEGMDAEGNLSRQVYRYRVE